MKRQTDPSAPWTHRGDWNGGTVTDVLIVPGTPSTIFAASRAGLFRSQNDGTGWQRSDRGLDDPAVLALAAAPDRSGRAQLFASTETGRLYRSVDQGETWQERDGWAGLGIITALAVSPNFAADATIFAATPAGPFRSQDGGQQWESATFGLVDLETLCIAVDPDFAQSETLWIGTAGGGLYRSRNGGRSWRDAGAGLPATAIQSLLIAGEGETQLMLAGSEDQGLFRWQTESNRWQALAPDLQESGINCLAATQDGNQIVAGSDEGLIFSSDGGASWQIGADGAGITLALSVAGSTVLAATWQGGVLRSDDGGTSWLPANGKTQALAVHAPPLAVLSPDGNLFLADLDGGWVVSALAKLRWQPVDVEMDAPLSALVGSGTDDEFVLMAGGGATLYRCFAGEEWESRTLPVEIAQIALSPDYLNDGSLLVLDLAGTLHRSTDDGDTWAALAPPWQERTPVALAFSPHYAPNHTIYAVTAAAIRPGTYQLEVWQSADGGDSWRDLAGFEDYSPVVSLLPLADAAGSICLGVQGRLIRLFTAADTGELAVEQHTLPDAVRITALAAVDGDTSALPLLLATNRGVWHAPDGSNWQPLGRGLDDQLGGGHTGRAAG